MCVHGNEGACLTVPSVTHWYVFFLSLLENNTALRNKISSSGYTVFVCRIIIILTYDKKKKSIKSNNQRLLHCTLHIPRDVFFWPPNETDGDYVNIWKIPKNYTTQKVRDIWMRVHICMCIDLSLMKCVILFLGANKYSRNKIKIYVKK